MWKPLMKSKQYQYLFLFPLLTTLALSLLTVNVYAQQQDHAILSDAVLKKMGYKQIKKHPYNDKLCRRYEGDLSGVKSYQSIKALQPMPRKKNIYYRFTLIKEVFSTPAIAQQRLQQTQPPYSFKTDSLYEKMCALKEGFVIDHTAYFVATDAYLFMQELPQVLLQLKTHFTPKTLTSRSRQSNKTIQTTSDAFTSLPEKIEFLQRYVTFRRHYQQLSFAIHYHDNSTGWLAAPSDWDSESSPLKRDAL